MSFWDVSQKLTIHSRLKASSLLTTRKCIGRTVPNTVHPKQHSNKLSHTVYKYKSANFEGLRADMAAYAAMFLMENPTSRTTEENWKPSRVHYIKPSLNMFQRQSPKLNDTCPGSHGTSRVKFGRKTGSIAKQESKKSTKTGQPTVQNGNSYRNY